MTKPRPSAAWPSAALTAHDDGDHERVDGLDKHGGAEPGQPGAEEVVAGAWEDADDQRDRREGEQNQGDDLRKHDGQRKEPEQEDHAERADEDHRGECQTLVGAAGLLYVDGGGVGLVDDVAAELRVVAGRFAVLERLVLGVAFV
jgi:hypothetical protein